MKSKEEKKRLLDDDLAELERVGKQPFTSWLDPNLVGYDLSVLKKRKYRKNKVR